MGSKPFGIIKDSLTSEVDSYLDELTNRASVYINSHLPKLKDSTESSAEQMFHNSMNSRDLAAAIVWKAIGTELLRSESIKLNYENLDEVLYRRIVIIIQMIRDDVIDLIENINFGFLETMTDNELKNELDKAFLESEIPSIVFFIAIYSLKKQMSKLSGIEQ